MQNQDQLQDDSFDFENLASIAASLDSGGQKKTFTPVNKDQPLVFLDPRNCPPIPPNVSVQDFLHYFKFPEFESMFSFDLGVEAEESVKITVHHGEHGINTARIPYRLFNPAEYAGKFPKFILNMSYFRKQAPDYIRRSFFNQNELLYMALHHRFAQYSREKTAYTYLLTKDIKAIGKYIDYNVYNSVNAIQKAQHTYAVLEVFTQDYQADYDMTGNVPFRLRGPIGDHIKRPVKVDGLDVQYFYLHENMSKFLSHVPIVPSSESPAADSAKFVLSNLEIYRAVGFKLNQKDRMIKTIFPIKANIPARLKTHVTGDSFRIDGFSVPIFEEDVVPEAKYETDGTLLNAVVVFLPIENDGRFLCGEIECSKRFSDKIAIKREIIKGEFVETTVREGEYIPKHNGEFVIGITPDSEIESRYGFETMKVVSVSQMGVGYGKKIVADCTKRIGASRIISASGIKGVTKPRFGIGKIRTKNAAGVEVEMNVDLLVGPNSIKGKANTIHLAQAALAHKLGFSGNARRISSLDEELINKLADNVRMEQVLYTDETGYSRPAYAGIVPVKVTELAYLYKNAKNQSFMTQSGWYLYMNGYPELAEHIYATSVSQEDREIIVELTKIYYDDTGIFNEEVPVYSIDDLAYIFNRDDIVLETNPLEEHKSKILDLDFNKGFYIYMSNLNQYIRMPSARLLRRFSTKLEDGSWIYKRVLTATSQIIQQCIVPGPNGQLYLKGLIWEKEDKATGNKIPGDRYGGNSAGRVGAYLNTIYNLLHGVDNLLRDLMYPNVFGCSMKQMVDTRVPRGTVVIVDRHLYEKLAAQAEGYMAKDSKFYALAIRNPTIWKSQIQCVIVWDYEMFHEHLKLNTTIKDIDTYINLRGCKDLIIMNPEDAIQQESDVDGDLMPLFVPKGEKAQIYLRRMYNAPAPMLDGEQREDYGNGVKNIVRQEFDWIKSYRSSEMESNELFEKGALGRYKLYNLPIDDRRDGQKSFAEYFRNSVIAKADVAIGTNNLWQLQILLDLFRGEIQAGNVKGPNGRPIAFTDRDHVQISYAYTRILQDSVIRSIKWNESGSIEFTPFLLRNILKDQYRNSVFQAFVSRTGIDARTVNMLFFILGWAEGNGLAKQVSAFVSMYNRGSSQGDEKVEITVDTWGKLIKGFYGSRLKTFYDVKSLIDSVKSGKAQKPRFDNGGITPNDQNSFTLEGDSGFSPL